MNKKIRRVIAFLLMLIMLSGVVGPENLMMLTAYAEEVKPESTETSEPGAAGGDDAAETEVKDEEPTVSQTAEPTEDPMPAASQPETGEEANEPTREDSSDSPQTESKADESEAAYTTKPVELMKDMALTLSGDLPEGAAIGFEETEYEFDESKGSLLFAAKLIVSDAAGESLKCEGSVTATLKGEAVRELLEADEVFSLIVNARGSEAKHLKAKDDTVSFRLTRFDLFVLYLEGEEETIEIPAQEPVDEPSADIITADGEDEITADGEDEITADGEDAIAALTEEAATSVSDESEPSEQSLELSALTGELSPAATEGLDTSLASAPVSVTQSAAVAATASYRMEQETVYLKDILSALKMSVKNNTKLSVTPAGLVTLSEDTYKNKNKDSITLTANTYFDEATLTIGKQTVTLSYPDPDAVELIDYSSSDPLKPEAPADAIWANDVLYLTGKMPANAVVDCVPVEIEIDGEYVIAAYDIKIYANANQKAKGKQWQPNGNKVQVHFFAAESEDAVHVYHMADGTTTAQLVDTVTPNDGWVAFDAEHFSTYGFSFFEDLIGQTLDAALNKLLYKDTVFENDEIILTGNLPRNAIIEAKKVDVEIEGQDSILAYDIKIYQNSFFKLLGIVWQPKDGNPISVKVKSDAFAGRENVSIYHMADENAEPEFVTSVSVEDESVVFTAESFSIYPIVDGDTGENARIGYRFWYPDSEGNYQEIVTQWFRKKDIEGGQRLYVPTIPGLSQEEYTLVFDGWYKGTGTGDSLVIQDDEVVINAVNDPETRLVLNTELVGYAQQADNGTYTFVEGTIYDIYAKFKTAYYITYVDVNPTYVLSTDLVLKTANSTFTPRDNVKPTRYKEKLKGWRELNKDNTLGSILYTTDSTDTENYQASYPIDHNMTLIPVIDGGYYLIFNDNDIVNGKSGGASYTPAVFYMSVGDDARKPVKPEDPTWAGYSFGGWYTTAECNDGEEFFDSEGKHDSYLTRDTVVHAKWIPAETTLRVIFWKQAATANGEAARYDYAVSRTITTDPTTGNHIKTGDTYTLEARDTNVFCENGYAGTFNGGGYYTTANGFDGSDKYYFSYNSAKTDASVVAAADGSATLNVYYDRKTVTLNFYIYDYNYTETTGNNNTQYGLVDGQYVKLTRSGSYPNYTWTYVSGTEYTYTVSDSNRSGNYYIPDGNGGYEEVYLYRNNNRWYKTRTGWFSYTYTDEYTGNVYTRSETDINTPYTGTRYTRGNGRSWRLYKSYTGLYNTTLEQNGYTWPSEYWWYSNGENNGDGSGTRTTFMAAFLPSDTVDTVNFYGTNPSDTSRQVHFIRQKLDGSYDTDNEEVVQTGNGTFSITDKYTGFHAASYSTNNSTWTQLGSKDSDGVYAKVSSYTNLYIRFDRTNYPLHYHINSDSATVETVQIPFGTNLSGYSNKDPGSKAGYFVDATYDANGIPTGWKWYTDQGYTQEFDFSSTTMPAGEVNVYCKWIAERYRPIFIPGADDVSIDPGQSLSFRLDYGETVSGTLLNAATRPGYIFDGWHASAARTASCSTSTIRRWIVMCRAWI